MARKHRADVVLMDMRMPGVDGLEATWRIAADDDLAGVRVIILTTFESDEYVYQAIRSGASGFLVKDSEPAELIQAARVVARGDALLSPSVTRKLITDLASRPGNHRPTGRELDGLTERERQVMTLVAAGLSNDEIAGKLFVSWQTLASCPGQAAPGRHRRWVPKNLGPADKSLPKTTSGVSRLAGQAGTQATDLTPASGQTRGSRAGSTIHSLPAEYGFPLMRLVLPDATRRTSDSAAGPSAEHADLRPDGPSGHLTWMTEPTRAVLGHEPADQSACLWRGAPGCTGVGARPCGLSGRQDACEISHD